uniref:ARID domain-containing protein n=1 Tax=Mola mola TaxID=94237 RepID=A0A3Q3X0H2_MOLML
MQNNPNASGFSVPQASPSVIEIHDSMTECEEEARPGPKQMEEKSFVSSLHSFMKDRGSPIERIPHLGFKQINLWGIYKAVEKLGGYESVTARRLWKKVYDELGGSPGSTSAATCTRRHYEKLVLPFERHIKGEEEKPLPPSKPRKPYKRNLDSKVPKTEKKRKSIQSEMYNRICLHITCIISQIPTQRSPEAACQSESVLCPLPVPTSSPWTAHIPSAVGEVISPLEKKKRMAQASLNLPLSPQSEEKDRPSVIQCSQSPARACSSKKCDSSDGSPVPLSSSSSRSPSPYSVSSEDGASGNEEKPPPGSEHPYNSSSSEKNTFHCSKERKTPSCSQISKEGHNKDASHASSHAVDSNKIQIKDSAWKQIHKWSGRYLPHTFHPSSSFALKSDWNPTATSSFTKVIPKSVQPLRPAPIRPGYKTHRGRLMPQDESVICAKKLSNPTQWLYQTENRERTRTMLQKAPATQQSLVDSTASLPVSYVLSGYEKSGRDSQHQPLLCPAFFSNRTRLPQSQLMYRHIPVGPSHSALIGSAVYPYPYSIPLLNPQTGYTLPAMNPIYRHKL